VLNPRRAERMRCEMANKCVATDEEPLLGAGAVDAIEKRLGRKMTIEEFCECGIRGAELSAAILKEKVGVL